VYSVEPAPEGGVGPVGGLGGCTGGGGGVTPPLPPGMRNCWPTLRDGELRLLACIMASGFTPNFCPIRYRESPGATVYMVYPPDCGCEGPGVGGFGDGVGGGGGGATDPPLPPGMRNCWPTLKAGEARLLACIMDSGLTPNCCPILYRESPACTVYTVPPPEAGGGLGGLGGFG